MFTYDLSTDIGLVRLKLGDTVEGKGPRPDTRNFSDEEITVALTTSNNMVTAAVAFLQDALANEWAVVSDFSIGPRSESTSQVATALKNSAQQAGGTTATSYVVKTRRTDGYSEDSTGEY